MFGREADGLPASVLHDVPEANQLLIPMQPGNRSINLSNAVSIVAYEAFRQRGFPGTAGGGAWEEARPPLQ